MGNISTYSSPDEGSFTYTYDNQGQLTKAVNGSTTYTYSYDGAGNILSKSDGTTSHSYTYTDPDWKDLLTAYDGQTISYDGAGNPTSYYNGTRWTFTWGNGKRLETASNGTNTISYNYTADGIRTSKTVNGVVHTYYYSNGLLHRETYGDTVLDFLYDANGVPFSLLVNRTNWYYYITNLQGDVIRLVDYLGNTAAYYEYDPYGNATKASGSHATINPLRYRGYYYDTETGMYYLQSRYYDPVMGRFINADSYVSTGYGFLGFNMFAYCLNNPVSLIDVTGDVAATATAAATAACLNPLWIVGALVVVGVVAIVDSIIDDYPPVSSPLSIPDLTYDESPAQSKGSSKPNSKPKPTIHAGETTSPTPPKGPQKDPRDQYQGRTLYEDENIHIDYEYNGNGTGNVHLQVKGKFGKYYYDSSSKILRMGNSNSSAPAPRYIQKYLKTPKIRYALEKGVRFINSLGG